MSDREALLLPDDSPFDEWVRYVFDHPVLNPEWWWDGTDSGFGQQWNELADPVRTLSYLTRLFDSPECLLGRLSRAQIDQGLHFLVSNTCSNHMFVLMDSNLPWADRRRCFDAMIPLYAKLMAPVYQDDLGHTDSAIDPQRPAFSCYEWWEVIPLSGGMDHCDQDKINDAVLNIFEQVLKLKAESCLESVLHGLRLWHEFSPERVEPIVRSFLTRSDISAQLRSYAEYAATGRVQ